MNIKLLTTSLLIVTSMQRQQRMIFDAPQYFGAECAGSLVIETNEGDRHTITESVTRIKIILDSVSVSGCGCYSIHSARYGRGSRRLISEIMGRMDRRDIGFGRIKSIYRIDCP